MGPTKVIPKESALYEVKTGKLVQDGLSPLERNKRPMPPSITLPCRLLIRPESNGFLRGNRCFAFTERNTKRSTIKKFI